MKIYFYYFYTVVVGYFINLNLLIIKLIILLSSYYLELAAACIMDTLDNIDMPIWKMEESSCQLTLIL